MKLNAVLVGVLFTMFSIPAYGDEAWVCRSMFGEDAFEVSRGDVVKEGDKLVASGTMTSFGFEYPAKVFVNPTGQLWLVDQGNGVTGSVIMIASGIGGYIADNASFTGEEDALDITCFFRPK